MQAVVFDMDGVLIDSEAWNEMVSQQFFREREFDMPISVTRSLIGASNSSYWQEFGKRNPGVPVEAARQGLHAFRQSLNVHYSTLLNPGVVHLLESLRIAGQAVGLASSSHRSVVEQVLDECAIGEYFQVVVCGDEVKYGKPAPDIYLTAAGLLGEDPKDCVAIEDSTNGIRAARAAGMIVLGKADSRFQQNTGLSHRSVDTLQGVDAALLTDLWREFS